MGYVPADEIYANNKNYYLKFFHIPTSKFVKFKAYITKFSDQFSSKNNPTQVFGRMDPIVTFQNTTRKISCGFTVTAASSREVTENMRKINLLMQMLYPKYVNAGDTSTIAASPLFRIKFANLIRSATAAPYVSNEAALANEGTAAPESLEESDYDTKTGLLGAIDGFTVSPNFNVGFQDGEDYANPMQIPLSFNFTVLHEHAVGWQGETDAKFGGTVSSAGLANQFPYYLDRAIDDADTAEATDAALAAGHSVAARAAAIAGEVTTDPTTADAATGAGDND